MATLREDLEKIKSKLYERGQHRPHSWEDELAEEIHTIMEKHGELLDAEENYPDDYPLR